MDTEMTEIDITRQIPLTADSGATRGRDCPEQAKLVAYTEARLGAEERAKLEGHLADCGFCLGQVGFLVRETSSEMPAVPGRLLDATRGVRVRWLDRFPKTALVPLASAAALILAVAVGLQLKLGPGTAEVGRPASEPAFESAPGRANRGPVRSGLAGMAAPRILHPEEGVEIAESRPEVLWEASPGALHYTVQIVNLEGDVVWEQRSSGLSAVVPPTVELEPGQRYFVWVEAQLQSGGSLKSAAVGFRIAARE
jgi:hypothetical protein